MNAGNKSYGPLSTRTGLPVKNYVVGTHKAELERELAVALAALQISCQRQAAFLGHLHGGLQSQLTWEEGYDLLLMAGRDAVGTMTIVTEDTHEAKVILECGRCQHQWVEMVVLPMRVEAFLARTKGWLVCPNCANKQKRTIFLLGGERYQEAAGRLLGHRQSSPFEIADVAN